MPKQQQNSLLLELDRAVRLFMAGSSRFDQRAAEELKLHPTDMQFLNLLELLGPLTPGALAQGSGLSSGGVTVVLDRLERAGYVRRVKNPADRRSVLVEPVPAREKQLIAKYAPVLQLRKALADFSQEELETVLKFFSAANAAQPVTARAAATSA